MNSFATLPPLPSVDSSQGLPTFESITLQSQNFNVLYDGGGTVNFTAGQMEFYPATAMISSQTHAPLILLRETVNTPVKDFEVIVDVTTVAQLRQGSSPNPWEVFWLFFNYTGGITDKVTNYFISKPAPYGSELGVASGEVTQDFLSDSSLYPTAVGERHVFTYKRKSNLFTVMKDGQLIFTFSDNSLKLSQNRGAIGFYCEDAKVQIHSVQYRSLD